METAELEQLVEENLGLMTELKEGSMPSLLMRESFGARGTYEGKLVAGANFYFNPHTGKIAYFANYRDKSRKDTASHEHGTIRVCMGKQDYEFMKAYYTQEGYPSIQALEKTPGITRQALEVLYKTFEQYKAREK